MTDSMTICRGALTTDVPRVADIHAAAFPGFFLTTLGPAFLRTMYLAFLSSAGGVFVVGQRNGRLDGFAVGVLKSAGKDRHMALRFLPQFLAALLPALLRNPGKVLKRIASQFLALGEEPEIPDGAAVLRSIGVLPEARGSGVASLLLTEFERQALAKGATTVALTTDAVDNERAIGFYLKQGYTVIQEFRQDKSRQMFLMLKDLHQPS